MTEKGHGLIVGQTMSGKTTLATRMSHLFRKSGINTVVLDRYRNPAWNATVMFRDFEKFYRFVSDPDKCLQCVLFVDEAGFSLSKYSAEADWLTMAARHHGHRTFVIANRAEMVSCNLRSQCESLFAFCIDQKDAQEYARAFIHPTIEKICPTLGPGEFIKATRFQPPKRFRLWKA